MNELSIYTLIFFAGILLGGFFFGGLLWTSRRGLLSKNPAFLFISSALIRFGVTLAGFYFLAAPFWDRIIICLIGFIAARYLIIRFVQQSVAEKN